MLLQYSATIELEIALERLRDVTSGEAPSCRPASAVPARGSEGLRGWFSPRVFRLPGRSRDSLRPEVARTRSRLACGKSSIPPPVFGSRAAAAPDAPGLPRLPGGTSRTAGDTSGPGRDAAAQWVGRRWQKPASWQLKWHIITR